MITNDMNYAHPQEIPERIHKLGVGLGEIIPSREEIPEEFCFTTLVNENRNPYYRMMQEWFFSGLPLEKVPPAKEGIERDQALIHLETILRSFEPKHEHKFEAATYLASLWLEEPSI